MLLIIVMATVIVIGLAAIALAEPRRPHEVVVWNDDAERRLLYDRKLHAGWW
jgi:threonine dehydrogenase-like Zn-dependent dehydrogenase